MAVYVMYLAIAMALTLVATPLVKKLAVRWGAVDKPDHRKVHTRIMPRLGGLAIYISFAICFFLFVPKTKEALSIFIGGTIIVITGAIDDRYQISPKAKLLGQIIAATIVMVGGLRVELFNLPFDGQINFSWLLSIPITMLWVVGVTNAVNLIDGLDGLAAGVSGIALLAMSVMAFMMANTLAILFGVILLGAVIGFLFFNFHPAKIFMGDTGSLFLGFNLAALSVLGFKQVALMAFIVPILILGVPLSDTFYAIVRRWLHKEPIFQPDKNHLHHCLLSMGYSHRKTVIVIYSISAVFALSAVLLSQSKQWAAVIFIGVLLILLEMGSEAVGLMGKKTGPLLRFVRLFRVREERLENTRSGK
ncbi:undecaprenyl-phosphate alpha-N-acetylglucosaminyl 1-phosphate transferase [Ammoniphilus oxalaticus]|uniref:Undecaprenyl-phosphate alpha-N-acetylglucosaminyl 1-phosphate transferase n=1 Tax=Ammoniphilus oxalaticus TaxID=66863 RepID=A0A419SF48_9BACL|nr:MraY family glycosyltransferase [Ammoniphilus oxalaticus]RKD22079.1 undecaprenyl-phosphate alpha-N-acetylglucosaminyl 1-phosphate transferase [Ammoniphilus oxalaticus]